MASKSSLILPVGGADAHVDITPDLPRAEVVITIMLPFSDSVPARVNLFEFLKIAADIQVKVADAQLAAMKLMQEAARLRAT